MKAFLIATLLLTVTATEAGAQRTPPYGPRITLPSHVSPFGGRFGGGHFKRGHFAGFIVVEREVPVIIEREVVTQ